MVLEDLVISMSQFDWFSNVGNMPNLDFEYQYIISRNTAIEKIKSLKWENTIRTLKNDTRNNLKSTTAREIIACYKYEWKYFEKNILTIFKDRLLIVDYRVYEAVYNSLDAICFDYYVNHEITNSDLKKMYEIYSNGNLPCGWSGYYPNGKLEVF